MLLNRFFLQFCPSILVQGDQVFTRTLLQTYLFLHSILSYPTRLHSDHKSAAKPENRITLIIYPPAQSALPIPRIVIQAGAALRISKNLYGSDTLSALEMAKCYTKLVIDDSPATLIILYLICFQGRRISKEKLNRNNLHMP